LCNNLGRQNLAKKLAKINCKVFAEIGVWEGETTSTILEKGFLSEYWAVDQWRSYIAQQPRMRWTSDFDKWDEYYLDVCKLMLKFPELRIIKESSNVASKLFPIRYFDVIFIDADHAYKSVLDDIANWLPLVKKGGILCGDDWVPGHPGVRKAVIKSLGIDKVKVDKFRMWWYRV